MAKFKSHSAIALTPPGTNTNFSKREKPSVKIIDWRDQKREKERTKLSKTTPEKPIIHKKKYKWVGIP